MQSRAATGRYGTEGSAELFDGYGMRSITGDQLPGGIERPKPIILVFPFAFLSHYLRCIVVSKMLGDGYTALFAGDDKYTRYVYGAGYRTFDCLGWSGPEVLEKLRKFDFSWLNEGDLQRLVASRLAAIKKYQPALVIGDNDPALKMAAEQEGVRYISVQNGYMSKYYAGIRTIPRKHCLWQLMNLLPGSLSAYLVRKGEAYSMRRIHEPFRRLRSRDGLATLATYLDELEGDVNLICDLPELFPQQLLPPNYFCVGPLIYDEHVHKPFDLSALASDKPTIYVNMGSTGEWRGVEFLNDPYYSKYNIVTAGDENYILRRATLWFSFIPGAAIMPFVDLVICHGGNGIINQAIYYKRRILCRTAYFEQEWNADALERKGWGRSIDGVRSPKELRRIVDEWVLIDSRPDPR